MTDAPLGRRDRLSSQRRTWIIAAICVVVAGAAGYVGASRGGDDAERTSVLATTGDPRVGAVDELTGPDGRARFVGLVTSICGSAVEGLPPAGSTRNRRDVDAYVAEALASAARLDRAFVLLGQQRPESEGTMVELRARTSDVAQALTVARQTRARTLSGVSAPLKAARDVAARVGLPACALR